jgi:hypothetical protein
MEINGTKHMIQVDTNVSKACDFCSERVGGDHFQRGVNHYLEEHGCILLHVGTLTDLDHNGNFWHHTVAILGAVESPAPRAPLNLTVSFAR